MFCKSCILILVQLRSLKVLALDLISQPLWGEHFDERASGEERRVEVRSGPQGELEVGVIILGGHFLLAVVQRQIPQVINLLAIGPDGHLFHRGVFHPKDAVVIAEESHRIKAFRVAELLDGGFLLLSYVLLFKRLTF